MSDNIQLPTGQVIATKDYGGIHYQRVRMTFTAPDGSPIEASAAAPLPTAATITAWGAGTLPVAIQGTPSVAISGTPNVAVTSTPGLTDAQLRAAAVPVQPVNASDDSPFLVRLGLAILRKLEALANPVSMDLFGRTRVVIDGQSGGSTLTGVTTVTTVTTVATTTTLNQLSGISTSTMVYDSMHLAWCDAVRRRIT